MYFVFRHILNLALVLSTVIAQGQSVAFRYIGDAQGMNTIASWGCAIDAYGFFWISTSDGLMRFNGKETSYYYTRTHPELPYDQIGYLFCDSRNQVWVSTGKGLACVDTNRKLHRHVIEKAKPERSVLYCFEGGQREIYAISEGNAFLLDTLNNEWISQPWLDSIISDQWIRDLRRFDRDKYLLVSQNKGIIVFDTKSKKQHAFISVNGAASVTRFDDESILVGVSSHFGLIHANVNDTTKQNVIEPPPNFTSGNPHSQIKFMVTASNGHVYMTTTGEGLLSVDPTLTTYTHYKHDPVNPSTIADNSPRYIVADSTGNLLITTVNGVNYTNIQSTSITHINYLQTPEGEILDNRVISIAEDVNKRLWLCMHDKVLILNEDIKTTAWPQFPKTHKWHHFPPSPINVERDAMDNMWVSLRHEGIGVFYPDGRFKKFISAKDYPGFGVAINQTRVLREGNDGYMYLGTEDGLYRIRHLDFSLDTFPDDPEMAPLKDERIVDILSGRNELWVSSSPRGAAWHYSFSEKKMHVYSTHNGLSSNRVYGLTRDHLGNVYAGCYDGLSIIHTDSSIVQLLKDQGLISPRIEALETADDGSVWLANNYNLLKYDPADGSIKRLGGRQGLKGVDFVIVGSRKLSSGKLAFGVNKGLIIVDPATLKIEHEPLHVYVFYHDADGLEMPCHSGNDLVLPYNQRNMRFSFVVKDLMVADQILFRYRISSGTQTNWSPPSLNSYVDFSPGSGSYTLEVEAYDGSEWYALPFPVRVIIKHPWWRQWWFITIVMLVIVGSLIAFYRNKLNSYRKELLIERQISDLESRALRAQMNPHFVFNCLNAIQECVVTGRIDEAYTYLSKFSRLLRLVLEHSDLTETSLHQELEILDLYVSLEKLRFKEPIDFRLDISDEIETEQIHTPPMLIQPHIENAIWHGLRHRENDRKLTIYIKEEAAEYLLVTIEDNGIGRTKGMELKNSRMGASQRHNSKGLSICTQRIELLQKQYPLTNMEFEDLYTEHGIAAGTRVTVVLPIVPKNSIEHMGAKRTSR